MTKFDLSSNSGADALSVRATRETDVIDRFVGEQIRLYRSMVGISQQKLAECLGVTFQQLQKYERGDNRIGAGRLLMVANALGVPISFLLDQDALSHKERGTPVLTSDSRELSREGYSIARAFSQIVDPAVRRSISTLVHSLGPHPGTKED